MASKELSPKRQCFVDEYLKDLNATQAAIRAGYSKKTAQEQGSRLLSNVMVKRAIEAGKLARQERTQITADDVLRRWAQIATADPNELVEHRRACCRHCWGRGSRYQRTAAEMEAAHAAWEERTEAEAKEENPPPLRPFDVQGGVGFDPRKPPSADCPACFGEGVDSVFVKDTRSLSPAALALYAGVKQTKDGVEVKMHDQAAALVNVAKHLGMFVEKHEHTGKDGGPIEYAALSDDELRRRIAELDDRIRRAQAGVTPPPASHGRAAQG